MWLEEVSYWNQVVKMLLGWESRNGRKKCQARTRFFTNPHTLEVRQI